MKRPKSLLGFSLIEVLLTLVLSMLIMNTISALWLGLANTSRMQEDQAQLQENGRLVSYILSRDLRMAGFIGCGKLTLNIGLPSSLNGYSGEINSWNPALPTTLKKSVLPETDVISLYYLALTPVVSLQLGTQYNQLTVGETPKFKVNDMMLISDCSHAEIFKLGSVQQQTKQKQQILVPTQNLNYLYKTTDELGMLVKNTYFIGNTGRQDALHQPITAFYVEDISGKNHEIVPNVVNMKIFYALKNAKEPLYFTAAQISQNKTWDAVKQVKIALLLKSTRKFSNRPTQYKYLDKIAVDPHGYLYKEWDLVISLRER